jgi:predicted nucleic acid-binding protein
MSSAKRGRCSTGAAVTGSQLPPLLSGSALSCDEHITAELEEQAWEWLARHDERECSFVDATSFALMRSKNVDNAYAFDGDFSAAGFREMRP